MDPSEATRNIPTSSSPTRVVLAIAGSDSSGGAGIAADIKTGGAFGVFVATAITALTAQNPERVAAIYPTSPAALRAQIDAVCESLPAHAIKLGMLGNPELVRTVSDFIRDQNAPVVADPVLGATSGSTLWQGEDPATLYKELIFPYATVITPNLPEAAFLLGENTATTDAQMEDQARALQAMGAKAVLLKGGHLDTPLATDYLLASGEYTPQPISTPRVATRHSHGSGCSLATAIAAGLAQGLTMKQAVAAAKTYIQGALSHSARLALVPDNGPVHHFYSYW